MSDDLKKQSPIKDAFGLVLGAGLVSIILGVAIAAGIADRIFNKSHD